jgi:hypothetical protein
MGKLAMRSRIFPSHPRGGEGRAASAAEGEGSLCRSTPAPRSALPSRPLPLKGEGAVRIASQPNQNSSKHRIEVGHHVAVGEPQHAITALLQGFRTSRVVSFASDVGVSVKLDNETFGSGREIGNVRREHDLSLELHAEPVCAKLAPEAAFRFGEVDAQAFRAISGVDVPLHTPPSPCPLPLKGERGRKARHASTPFESVHPVNA